MLSERGPASIEVFISRDQNFTQIQVILFVVFTHAVTG